MMYYTTVTGWMVNYFGKFLTGALPRRYDRRRDLPAMFGTMLGSPGAMVIFTELVVVTGLPDRVQLRPCRRVWSGSPRS